MEGNDNLNSRKCQPFWTFIVINVLFINDKEKNSGTQWRHMFVLVKSIGMH